MVVVLCSCSPGESEGLARTLVSERLAACVNVIPGVRSFFWWEGRLCEEAEHTLVVKTSDAQLPALAERIRALHSYDLPEILVLAPDLARSDPRYIGWVDAVVGSREEPRE